MASGCPVLSPSRRRTATGITICPLELTRTIVDSRCTMVSLPWLTFPIPARAAPDLAVFANSSPSSPTSAQGRAAQTPVGDRNLLDQHFFDWADRSAMLHRSSQRLSNAPRL